MQGETNADWRIGQYMKNNILIINTLMEHRSAVLRAPSLFQPIQAVAEGYILISARDFGEQD